MILFQDPGAEQEEILVTPKRTERQLRPLPLHQIRTIGKKISKHIAQVNGGKRITRSKIVSPVTPIAGRERSE